MKAEEIVHTEFERSYKYSTDLSDNWAGDGTESTMKVHYLIILIQSLMKFTEGSLQNNTSSCVVEEHFQ